MATSRKTGLRHADLPAIDVAHIPGNVAATRALSQIRELLNTRFGQGGNQIDKGVTWGDLVENGIVTLRQPNGRAITVGDPSGPFVPPNVPVVDGIPPAPTGLTVSSGLGTVFVEWDRPTFDYFGYAEVYRNTVDNLATATKIGETAAWVYADPLDASDATFFYWVRFISVGGKVGPFNGVGGEPGAVSLDPAYLIDVLSSDDPTALLYKIPADTVINGVPVPAGVYVRDAYIANGSISNAKIGNAVIDDAKIASLSAAKVTFGEMSGDRIAANSLNANRITTATLVAALASITTAYIGTANINDLAVTTAKIGNASITTAKIANLAVSTAQIDTASITNAKMAAASISTAQIVDGSITTAKIGTAQIVNAHIVNAQVDRLKIAGQSATTSAAYDFGYWSGQLWDGNWRDRGAGTIFVPENAHLMVAIQNSFDPGISVPWTVSNQGLGPNNRNFDMRVLLNGGVYGNAEIPRQVETVGSEIDDNNGTIIATDYAIYPLTDWSFIVMCFNVSGAITVNIQYRLRNETSQTRALNTATRIFLLTAYR